MVIAIYVCMCVCNCVCVRKGGVKKKFQNFGLSPLAYYVYSRRSLIMYNVFLFGLATVVLSPYLEERQRWSRRTKSVVYISNEGM